MIGGVEGLILKEVTYWNRKVMLPEVKVNRYQQIDPSAAANLLSYFRLSQGIPEVTNFAEHNPDYYFEDTNPRFLYAQWLDDYQLVPVLNYDWTQ